MCKPLLNYSAPYVPLDTILDAGRVLRRPLGEWANQLVAILRSCMDATPALDTMYQASAALNNAALVFAHAGLSRIAEEVCQSQLDWLASFRGVLPEEKLAVLAMQPWVNLGRLCRRAGSYERAHLYFSELRRCRLGGAVKFGSWHAPVSHTFYEEAQPIYVYESMRTYLQADDPIGAISFTHSLDEPMLRNTLMLKTELLIHIYLRRREPVELLPLIKSMPWPDDQYGVLARYFYTATAFAEVGEHQSCAKSLQRLRPQLSAYVERQVTNSRDIRLVLEACRLAAHLGLCDLFQSMLSIGSSLILRAADVPFAVAILGLSTRQGCSIGMEAPARLENFISFSGYPIPPSKSPSQTIATQLAGLQSAISQLLCVPALACSA